MPYTCDRCGLPLRAAETFQRGELMVCLDCAHQRDYGSAASAEELADPEGAQCQCGHVATMVCPDCGQPICEECALDVTVPLWPQGLEALASGNDTFWFCQRCAPAEEVLAALAEQNVTEWAAQPVADYDTDTGEEGEEPARP